ncbi:alpha-glucan water dikinase 2-like isoform X2 [Cynara cardunculus var. scolymus]|uniref:alpha-glucan water dikinase 2-like isoform X2 n=1 Tax=Cynara cardunculus var. scolymus TaxID=59895 RepID=UPI000D623251|nr:alpha-glucan water dikinase 2-like isoform X2 [Cynara cardunculus var. scolymus]
MEKAILCLKLSHSGILSPSFCLVTYFSLQFYQILRCSKIKFAYSTTYSPLWHPSTLPKALGLKFLNLQMEWYSRKWFIPSSYPSGTTIHKKTALRTPFIKDGDAYVVVIELRDPKIHAIEFFLKETRHDKRLKMNGANFCIKLHEEIVVEHDAAGNAKCLLNEMPHKGEVEKLLKHSSTFFPKPSTSSSIWQGLSRKNNTFSNMYAMSLEEAHNDMVGEKSYRIRFLSKQVPAWIRFPASIVIPFGVFEKVLSEDINKEVAKKMASLHEHTNTGDVLKLKTIQETVLQMKAPRKMSIEVRKKMKSSRIPWPRGLGEDTWDRVWQAIKEVWASKWNEGAYIPNMNHDKRGTGILIQEHVRPDYAFVTYTNHPVSHDSSQIYTEIVKGSIESLIGASPGRAMSSITKKSDLKSPIVTCYPSKSIGLYTKNKRSIIFRPDFVYENTNEYTGGGTYNSVLMDYKKEVVLDYSRDPMVVDPHFQALIHSKIAKAAKIIEDAYGCAQDIEGVVQDGELYVLQCKSLKL